MNKTTGNSDIEDPRILEDRNERLLGLRQVIMIDTSICKVYFLTRSNIIPCIKRDCQGGAIRKPRAWMEIEVLRVLPMRPERSVTHMSGPTHDADRMTQDRMTRIRATLILWLHQQRA